MNQNSVKGVKNQFNSCQASEAAPKTAASPSGKAEKASFILPLKICNKLSSKCFFKGRINNSPAFAKPPNKKIVSGEVKATASASCLPNTLAVKSKISIASSSPAPAASAIDFAVIIPLVRKKELTLFLHQPLFCSTDNARCGGVCL